MSRWIDALKKLENAEMGNRQNRQNPRELGFVSSVSSPSGRIRKNSVSAGPTNRASPKSADGGFVSFVSSAFEQNTNFSEPRDDGAGRYADWTDEALRDLFDERAAIMEFDGGLTRQQAEAAAWREVFCDESSPG